MAALLRLLEAFAMGVMLVLLSAWIIGTILRLQLLGIQTNSMRPIFSSGDAVVVQHIKQPLRVGDIVAYKSQVSGQIITHRLRAFTADKQLIMQGDALNASDSPITTKQVVGRAVLVIGRLGWFMDVIRKPQWLILLLAVPMSVVLSAEIFALQQRVSGQGYSVMRHN